MKLQLVSNVFSANTLGAGSLLPYNKPAVVFDFLDPANSWIVPVSSGIYQYTPGIAEIKNGGLTSDSNIIDGRQWLATPFNTATDTITLIPSGSSTPETRVEYLSKLLQLARQANAYNTQSGELRPVNMCVNEPGDAGDRYSRVDDIQYAISGDMFADPATNLQLTLTIVRYQFWTPVPLGTNPKVATFLARGLTYDDFLVPTQLALHPDDISDYNITTTGVASSFTTPTEGYTPDIGFGNIVVDWVSGTDVNGSLSLGAIADGVAPVTPSTSYTVSFWIRSESASYDAVPLRILARQAAPGDLALAIGSNFTVTVAAGWVKQSLTFTTGVATTSVWFILQKNTSATNASYDIYGLSFKLAANPLDLTEYGNANANLRSWREETIYNIWTREDPASLRLNYMDFAATEVPGDAPALLSMVVDRNVPNSITGAQNLYLARRLDIDANTSAGLEAAIFMAENSTINTSAPITTTYAVDANRGIDSSPQGNARNNYVISVVFAGALIGTPIVCATWLLSSLRTGGKFAVFARGDYTAGTPADLQFFVRAETPNSFASSPQRVETQPRALANVASNVALNYMGAIDLTWAKNILRTPDGLGSGETFYNLSFVAAARTAITTGTYLLTDLILLPIDDQMLAVLDVVMYKLTATDLYTIIDNTGYFNQSQDGIALYYDNVATDVYQQREADGQFLTLEPNRLNRIYALLGNSNSSPISDSTNTNTLRFRCNIIPQWRRLRSV